MKSLQAASVDVTPLLAQLRLLIAHEEELSRELAYVDCFKGTNRRRTMIVAFSSTVPSLFGVPLLAHASYFMQVVGMSSSLSIMVLILGVVLGLLANAVGIFLVSRFRLRQLMLGSLATATFIWLSMGIAGFWFGTIGFGPYTAACLMAVVVVCGMEAGPASFAVNGETSSLRLRAKTQGIGLLSHMLSNLALGLVFPYTYNTDASDLKGKKMKGRTAMDIDTMFEATLRCADFEKWSSSIAVDKGHPALVTVTTDTRRGRLREFKIR
ncbi:hypothetical protein N7467_005740 [Penicillium canescens]|nr:hypothetical protein N7467_005740 [Penicillium canescens]